MMELKRKIGITTGFIGLVVYILTVILGLNILGWNWLFALVGAFLIGYYGSSE